MGIISAAIGIVNPVAGVAMGALGKAKSVAKSIPWQLWAAIIGVLLLGIGGCVHSHKVKAFGNTQYQAGVAAEHARMQKQLDQAHKDALDWKTKFEAKAAAITQDIRGRHEETLRSHGAVADDQRLRGPGAARCGQGDHSGLSSAAGGHQPASGNGDAAGPGLPQDDRAAVPWPWLVGRAQQCDDQRSEALSWREWYQRQSALSADHGP